MAAEDGPAAMTKIHNAAPESSHPPPVVRLPLRKFEIGTAALPNRAGEDQPLPPCLASNAGVGKGGKAYAVWHREDKQVGINPASGVAGRDIGILMIEPLMKPMSDVRGVHARVGGHHGRERERICSWMGWRVPSSSVVATSRACSLPFFRVCLFATYPQVVNSPCPIGCWA